MPSSEKTVKKKAINMILEFITTSNQTIYHGMLASVCEKNLDSERNKNKQISYNW